MVNVEPDHRIVVLARALQIDDNTEPDARSVVGEVSVSGDACLGRALYRHRSIFRSTSDAPIWSHLELSYFQAVVPFDVIDRFCRDDGPAGAQLLRAELLVTTPGAFVMPHGWQGSAERPDRVASLEYIDVGRAYLRQYRDIMRDHIGPAAARLVAAGKIGTFRTMETAAVLYRHPSFAIDWNQIHLCEVDADSFQGFGQLLDDARDDASPGGAYADLFSSLDRMRSIPRWTLNDPVVDADFEIARAD